MHITIPPNIVVKHTGTERGRGVFTQRTLYIGDVVEQAPVIPIETPPNTIGKEVHQIMFAWDVHSTTEPNLVIALGYGSLYNHDNPANMCYEADTTNMVMKFIAARDIKAGEELTINYNALDGGVKSQDNFWFDNINITPITGSK